MELPGGGGGSAAAGGGGGGSLAALIQVIYESLELSGSQVRAAVHVADEVSTQSSSLRGMADSAGEPSVTAAISSFLSKWSYGLNCLHSDAESLAAGLQAAGRAYQALDAKLAGAGGGK